MEGGLRDWRRLRRIAATLLALALLAEHAAGRSLPVRFLVLALLWRAHGVAQAFIVRTVDAEAPDCGEPFAWRANPTDAAVLALRLRMLAAVVMLLSGVGDASAGRHAGPTIRSGRAPRRHAPGLVLLLTFPARRSPRPHDTS